MERTSDNTPAEKLCSSCGKAFGCGADAGECWCMSIRIKPETLADISEKYADCLCPACLARQAAAGESALPEL
jgi:Cysteine-rich CWC